MPSAFLQLDRRRVMKTAMAISAGCVVTRIGAAGHIGPAPRPAPPNVTSASSVAHQNPAVAARLAEIAGRNELRRGCGLPLLSVAAEFRRMKKAEADDQFSKFCRAVKTKIREKLLARIRRKRLDPIWVPAGMCSGMGFERQVNKQVKGLYDRIGKRTLSRLP